MGEGEVFYNLMVKSQSFNEPVPLGCDLNNVLSPAGQGSLKSLSLKD